MALTGVNERQARSAARPSRPSSPSSTVDIVSGGPTRQGMQGDRKREHSDPSTDDPRAA